MIVSSQPRQKIYNFSLIETIKIFFSSFNKKEIFFYFRKKFNSKYILPVSQCRVGIYLSIKAIIKRTNKKEILLSPFTVYEIVNMVKYAGGIPKFIDLNYPSAKINVKNTLKKLNSNTAAVIFTQYHSYNNNIKYLSKVLKKKKIYLVEDNAITYGCEKKTDYIYSDVKVYSFNITKFVSCIAGGLINVTKDKNLFNEIKNQELELSNKNFFFLIKKFLRAIKIGFLTNKFVFNFLTKHFIKYVIKNDLNIFKDLLRNDPKPSTFKNIPSEYKIKASNFQIKEIYLKIKKYNNIKMQNIRNRNYLIYQKNLKSIKEIKFEKIKMDHKNGCIFFPFYYRNRSHLYNYLLINNTDLSKYYYRDCSHLKIFKNLNSKCNKSKKLCDEAILLPTYPDYSKQNIYKNINLIKRYFKEQKK